MTVTQAVAAPTVLRNARPMKFTKVKTDTIRMFIAPIARQAQSCTSVETNVSDNCDLIHLETVSNRLDLVNTPGFSSWSHLLLFFCSPFPLLRCGVWDLDLSELCFSGSASSKTESEC